MSKNILLLISLLIVFSSVVSSQEVVLTDFPNGIADDVETEFFEGYRVRLSALADTLSKYPMVKALIIGSSDGTRFRRSHNAKNPSLALGRAQTLRNFLVHELNVDSNQIVMSAIQTRKIGKEYRYASVKIAWDLEEFAAAIKSISDRSMPVIPAPQVTEVSNTYNTLAENLKLQVGTGVTSSPFGALPVISASIRWKNVVTIESMFGHSFWNNNYRYFDGTDNLNLDTRKRLVGGSLTFFPFNNKDIGIIAGWARFEQVSQKFYEYVRMSEGPILGLRATPWEFLSVVGAYNPAKHREFGSKLADTKNNQFILSVTANIQFGEKNGGDNE